MSNTDNNLFPRGSEWHKWDLHVHTPYSYDWDSSCKETVDDLVKKAISEGISVIAITDHHEVKGITEAQRAAKGKAITILPGVEIRTDKGNKGVHIIGIFDQDVTPKTIYDKLLCPLNLSENDVKTKGNKQVYCNFEKACQRIHALGGLVFLHAGTKSSGIEQLDSDIRATLKKDLAFLVDVFEVTSTKQVEDYRNIVFPKIKQEFPCIITSDACDRSQLTFIKGHSTEVIGKKFCWIKADTTFEGLKQILFEPQPLERVSLTDENPAMFEHVVISSFTIDATDKHFFLSSSRGCRFNQGLNCVIGPRGSGKSTLLDAIGFTLGDNNVLKSERNNYVGYYFGAKANNASILQAKVRYSAKGNESTLTPQMSTASGFVFDYYYQKQIGYLADPNNEEMLSRFLFDKIFQDDSDLSTIFEELKSQQQDCRTKLAINRQKILACDLEISKENDVNAKIADKRSRVTFLTKESIKTLLNERANIIALNQRLKQLRKRLAEIKDNPVITEEEGVDIAFFQSLILSDLDPKGELLPKEWNDLESKSKTVENTLSSNRESLTKQVEELTDQAKSLEPSISCDKQLDEILEKITEQSRKENVSISKSELDKLDAIQKEILNLEVQMQEIQEKKNEKKSLLEERHRLLSKYNTFLETVRKQLETSFTKLMKGKGAVLNDTIHLEIATNLPLQKYIEIVQTQVKHNKEDDPGNFPNRKVLLDIFKAQGNAKIIDAFRKGNFDEWNMKGFGEKGLDYFNKVTNKEEVAMYLEEELTELTSRLLWRPDANRDFKYLKNCSIGERGTALLSVILIAGDEPLIIDQPEDDLDHYFLSQTLTPIIKHVKKHRQLIFATHDANIVVNGDAELILIVSTGDGQSAKIEPTTIENLSTRDKLIEILEGGRRAFDQRRRKYGRLAHN